MLILSIINLAAVTATAFTYRIGEFCSLTGVKNPSFKNKLCIVIGAPAPDDKEVLRVPVSCIKGDYYDRDSSLSIVDIQVPVSSIAEPDWDDVTQVRVVDLGFTVNGSPLRFPKHAMMNNSDRDTIARLTEVFPYPAEVRDILSNDFQRELLSGSLRLKMRLIGGIINQLYGFKAMQLANEYQASKRCRILGELISRTWDYVGDWMA